MSKKFRPRRISKQGYAHETFTSKPIVSQTGKKTKCVKGGRNVACLLTVFCKHVRERKYLEGLLLRLGCEWHTEQVLGDGSEVLWVIATPDAMDELTEGGHKCVRGKAMPSNARVMGCQGSGPEKVRTAPPRPTIARKPSYRTLAEGTKQAEWNPVLGWQSEELPTKKLPAHAHGTHVYLHGTSDAPKTAALDS